jgi:hypothetical protein
MRQPLPDIDARVDTRGHGSLDVPQRVVQQELVISNMNADRRQLKRQAHRGTGRLRRGISWLGRGISWLRRLQIPQR